MYSHPKMKSEYSDDEIETALSVDQLDAIDLLEEGIPGWNTYQAICFCLMKLSHTQQLPLRCIKFLFPCPSPAMYVFHRNNWDVAMSGRSIQAVAW